MNKVLPCLSAILLLIFISVDTQAYTIPQPPQPPSPTTIEGYTSNANTVDGTTLVADNFALPSAATITSITWWGLDQGGGWSGTADFIFTFYSDSSGAPGASILTASVSNFTSASRTAQISGSNYVYYVYTSDLSASLPAGAYWLSVFDNTDSTWSWMRSEEGSVPWSKQQYEGNWSPMPTNAAFELTYVPVPEPSVILLLGIGLIGVAIISRRKIGKAC